MTRLPRFCLLGVWPEEGRPDPIPCPKCGQGWVWPLGSVWFCPHCHWMWPEPEPKPIWGVQLELGLDGQGPLGFTGPRSYVDRFGNELLRRWK